ncbi:hypothetical protein FBY31_1724 [Arthrobacter sp. SLBN-100]|uniref:hypothetical protein n=1 Tax=Arthrobacter sp. SLBN-100 TaxID=2768450 RepID=UPI0011536146|nr:hypothetical protein [Arthrobacter sp. SLBN-100]TQJ67650.1 hypothetical protein FBY31_1724 [Arthrobacter sp. SLBN-100]
MFQLFKFLSTQQLVLQQLPVFLISFGIAAYFYKFGSFAIECIAFLVTWAVLDLISDRLFTRSKKRADDAEADLQMPR